MFSSKENINILTSLLIDYGVEHIVVCPGSRNAPIVHNFNESPNFICHPVTDERSAAFVALGIANQTGEMVAVCVTSGSLCSIIRICSFVTSIRALSPV